MKKENQEDIKNGRHDEIKHRHVHRDVSKKQER